MALVLDGNGPITGVSNVTFTGAGTISGLAQGGIAASKIGAGSVIQTVSYNYTGSHSSASTSEAATGAIFSITPIYSTSKIMILQSGGFNDYGGAASAYTEYQYWYRQIASGGYSKLITTQQLDNQNNTGSGQPYGYTYSHLYFDSPGTTSQVDYQMYLKSSSTSGYTYWGRSSRTGLTIGIVLMEIAQ